MRVKLLTAHHLEFLTLKGGCTVTCWERADLLALVCGVYCEFVTFPLVSWVGCGAWLYRFLIFAPLLTLSESTLVKKPHCWKSHVAAQFDLHLKTRNENDPGDEMEPNWLRLQQQPQDNQINKRMKMKLQWKIQLRQQLIITQKSVCNRY